MNSQNIIITGCSSGIGYQLAKVFANNQYHVLAISRNRKNLENLKDSLPEQYKQFVTIAVYDIANDSFDNLQTLITSLKWNSVDYLINNAGLLIKKPFAELSMSDFKDSYMTNLFAPAMLTKNLLPLLTATNQRKHIVNISSMGGVQGSAKFAGLSAYSSSKGALNTLTECMAEELREMNIACNALALGAVQTEMLTAAFPGYEAPLSAVQMADFVFQFTTTAHQFMNGKIIPVSLSTP